MMRWFTLVLVLFLAGCGADWFPSTVPGSGTFTNTSGASKANAPDAFFFNSDTSTDPFTTSNAVSLTGDFTSGWPVTVENTSPNSFENGSQVIIDGTAFSPGDTIPNVKPGQSIQLQHVTAPLGDVSVTKVTVGAYATTYTTTTLLTNSTTPDPFTFPADTFSLSTDLGQGLTTKTSAGVTLAGFTTVGWSGIFLRDLTGFGGEEIVINGGADTLIPGVNLTEASVLLPNQTINIIHNPGNTSGDVARTRIVVGNYSTVYQTTTGP